MHTINTRTEAQNARVATLEARLAELERAQMARDTTPSDPAVTDRLDALIVLNRELLSRIPTSSTATEASSPNIEAGPARANACDSSDPREQLRALVQQIHGAQSGFRGGLSRAQSEALRILLQRERALDAHNPWNEW